MGSLQKRNVKAKENEVISLIIREIANKTVRYISFSQLSSWEKKLKLANFEV